jgi:hypothetical protein
MRCGQVEERLSSLIDGELPERERGAIQSHLEACASCAGELVALRELRRRLRAWDEKENRVAPSRAFRQRVLRAAGVEAGVAPAARFPALRGRGRLLAVAGSFAAAALLLVAAWLVRPATVEPGRPDEVPALQRELARRLVAVESGDVEDRLELARWCAENGLAGSARSQYLLVLAERPDRVEARRALGLDHGSDAAPLPGLPEGEGLRRRLERLRFERAEPALAQGEPKAPARETVEFEGHELDRPAVPDYLAIRERERLLAGLAARRRETRTEPGSPSIAEPHAIAAYVASLEPIQPEAPNRFGTLTLLPVVDRSGATRSFSVLSIDAAFEQGLVDALDGGQAIVIRSRADVFIPAGTIFAGRTQDRVTRRGVIVRAETRTAIPAFCCEAGRQATGGTPFRSVTGMAGPGLRRLVLKERDQSLVWERIHQQSKSLRSTSRTKALAALYRNPHVRNALSEARKRLLPLLEDDRVVGIVAADGSRILGADLFGSHQLFALLAPRVLDGYLIDAFSDKAVGPTGLTPERAKAFLQSTLASKVYTTTGILSGSEEAWLRSGGLFGYGLADARGRPVHVSLFPVLEPRVPPEQKEPRAAPPPSAPPPGDQPPEPRGDRTDPTQGGQRIRDRRGRLPGGGASGGNGGVTPPPATPPRPPARPPVQAPPRPENGVR